MNARKKSVAPKPRVQRLIDAILGNQNDKRGQVFVGAPQAVTQPRAHGGTAGELGASLEKGNGRIVIDGLVVIDFTKHNSSDIFAVHGISSLIQAPLWP